MFDGIEEELLDGLYGTWLCCPREGLDCSLRFGA
jgi:hypothetical protein